MTHKTYITVQYQWMWLYVYEMFVLSRGDNDTVSLEVPEVSDCLAVIGVNDADIDDCGGGVDAEVPAKSARKRRRKACGVAPAHAVDDNCGDGLTLGVVLRELLKSHWSTSWTSSLGVGPPSSSVTSTQDIRLCYGSPLLQQLQWLPFYHLSLSLNSYIFTSYFYNFSWHIFCTIFMFMNK